MLASSGVGTGYVAIDRTAGFGAARAAVKAALADPLAMLSDRSPGARAPGALTQTKPAHEHILANTRMRGAPPAAGPQTPTERVLTSLRERPMIEEPAAPPPDIALPPSLLSKPGPPQILGPLDPGPDPGPGPFPPIIIPPTSPNPSGPNPPVTAVPEPATWGMLLIGFFAIGGALRRRRRAEATAAVR